tara:strand:- start:201 stop:515 length:315 start_codon:yes stop_codon:yes gene_type:complete
MNQDGRCDFIIVAGHIEVCSNIEWIEKDYQLEAFSGMSDCRGVDIYEGDIVEVSGCTYSIILDNGSFQMFHDDSHSGRNILSIERCRFIKIISSIHQNPELPNG